MSKKPGAVSAETREKILQAAGDEFYRLGFQSSSLRSICKKAGVTTGAVYFFFKGKDELFDTVISGVTRPFMEYMRKHYESERRERESLPEEKIEEDFAVSGLLIDFYFKNRQTWDILLRHLNHPSVQGFLDKFVEESTEHYSFLLSQATGNKTPDRFAIHQYVHMQVDAMLTLISHDFSPAEMTEHSRTVTKMLRAAFMSLFSD